MTGLRIVAALWVVLYHISGSLEETFARPLALVWPLIQAGWVGVDLFFVLSGFVVTHSYFYRLGPRFVPRDAALFLWARLARIWPVWALITGVMMVVLWVTGDAQRSDSYSAPLSVVSTIEQALLVQLWGEAGIARTSYVVPGWSLSAEWTAYLAFPLLVLVLYRLRNVYLPLLLVAPFLCIAPFVFECFTGGDNQDLWLLRIVGGFSSGAFIHLVIRDLKRSEALERFAPMVAIGCLVEITAVATWAAADTETPRRGVIALAFPLLVAALALSRRGVARFLSRPMMILGGKISFSLYLLHTVVFLGYESAARRWSFLAPGTPTYELLLLQVIALLLPASYLLWRYVEEPSRRKLIGLTRRGRPGPATVPPLGAVREASGEPGSSQPR